MRGRLGVALAVCALTGCTVLVDWSSFDLASLAGDDASPEAASGDGAPAGDGGGSTGDGALPTGDGGAGGDGGSPNDASTAGVSDGSPCGTTHTFCDDFDQAGRTLPGPWDVVDTNDPNVVLSLDEKVFFSSGRSFHASITPATGEHRVSMRKVIPVTGKRARIALDYRLDITSTTQLQEVDPVGVEMFPPPSGASDHSMSMYNYGNGPGLEYFVTELVAPNVIVDKPTAAEAGAWHHVEMTIDFNVAPATFVTKVDQAPAVSFEIQGTDLTSVQLYLGASYANDPEVRWDFHFDDVTFDAP